MPTATLFSRRAITLGNPTDLELGQRVFHQKCGSGAIAEIEGNKLEIDLKRAEAGAGYFLSAG